MSGEGVKSVSVQLRWSAAWTRVARLLVAACHDWCIEYTGYKHVEDNEYELRYLLDDEQRLLRLMTLVGSGLRERLQPALMRVRRRISELRGELEEEDSGMPRAA